MKLNKDASRPDFWTEPSIGSIWKDMVGVGRAFLVGRRKKALRGDGVGQFGLNFERVRGDGGV